MEKARFALIIVSGAFCILSGVLFCQTNPGISEARSTLEEKTHGAIPIDQKIAETAFITSVLEHLESGRPKDAEHVLRLRQGGEILAITQLLSDASEPSRRRAMELLSRIAKSHPTWKTDYHGTLPQADTNTTALVEAILKQYR